MDRVESMLGIAAKAGRIRSGLFLTEDAVHAGKARLVVVAEDAGENTVGTLTAKCRTRGVPLRIYGQKETLGHCIGKEYRSCAAVTDEGLARRILQLIDGEDSGSE